MKWLGMWLAIFAGWVLVFSQMDGVAAASTGTGIETVMNNMVSLILAVAGVGIVGAIGWRGLRFALQEDWRHAGESLAGVGLGAGLVATAKPVGAFIMATALASSFAPLPLPLLSETVGDLLALLLLHGPLVASLVLLRTSMPGEVRHDA
jgi:hypothetical protein